MTGDFLIPDNIDPRARQAAIALLELARDYNEREPFAGGCRAFYTPEQWADRGELYGTDALLIVCHDGGDFAPMFNLSYGDYELHSRQLDALDAIGVYASPCTCWYAAIYPHERPKR